MAPLPLGKNEVGELMTLVPLENISTAEEDTLAELVGAREGRVISITTGGTRAVILGGRSSSSITMGV